MAQGIFGCCLGIKWSKITFAMARQALIRTGFASAHDAAKIYGDSPKRVEELQRLLGPLKTKASEKRTASAGKKASVGKKANAGKKKSSVRTARKTKLAAKRAATSRRASRHAA